MRLNFLSLALLVPAFTLLLLAAVGWSRRDRRGARAFSALMLAGAIYSFAYALEISSSTLPGMLHWIKVEYLGISVIPALWLIFAVQYTGRDRWLTNLTYPLLFVIPLITLVSCYTNERWHFLYRLASVSDEGPFPMLSVTGGIVYWLHMAYINVSFLIGAALFLGMYLRIAPPYKKQTLIMLAGSLVPWVGNLIYASGNGPWDIDLNPFAFTVTGIGFMWGAFRYGLLDLVPVARATVFERMRDGVLVLDAKNRIADMNPAAARFLEATGSGIGKPAESVLNLKPEEIMAQLSHPIEGRVEVLNDSSGRPTWLEMDISSLPDRRGFASGRLIVIRDITERKRAESERLEMERHLLRAQKLESLGILAGGIAHDFNNLLMVILGNLELAQTGIPAGSPANANIVNAITSAKRAADIIRQILVYSGRGTFRKEAVNLTELVQEMVNLLRISISKNAVLDLNLGRALPPILADPGQIQQIVMNIIINAADAIGGQTGTITVTTDVRDCDEQYLMRSCQEEKPAAGRFIRLEVSDTGCGMDQQTRQLLFDPYFSTKFTGRGLGMSAVLGIVRSHNGAIIVESEVNRGTIITVLFPVSEIGRGESAPAQRTAFRPAEINAPPLRGTILIVDDEEMVCELGGEMVEQLGFHVLTAHGGEEALAVFRAHADDIVCVILDLTMPGMDGPTVFDHLLHIKPDVRVILSSGYSLHDAPQLFGKRGFVGFIEKPYTLQILSDELQRVLAD